MEEQGRGRTCLPLAPVGYMTPLLNERHTSHGSYNRTSGIAQLLKITLRDTPNWSALTPAEKESLELICVKLARICCGNSEFKDHWEDIAGYAKLIYERL